MSHLEKKESLTVSCHQIDGKFGYLPARYSFQVKVSTAFPGKVSQASFHRKFKGNEKANKSIEEKTRKRKERGEKTSIYFGSQKKDFEFCACTRNKTYPIYIFLAILQIDTTKSYKKNSWQMYRFSQA